MIAQTPHTFSGIEVALLDLLGKKEQCPIYSLLGYEKTTPKVAYASILFGKTPQETINFDLYKLDKMSYSFIWVYPTEVKVICSLGNKD